MKISYYKSNDIEYAKIPGKSVRNGKSVCKEGEVYLGRVVDKKSQVYYNRKRGIFTYDPDTQTYAPADETFSSEFKEDGRKKPKVLLDFGDSFFVDELLKKMKYSDVLNTIDCRNKDTLYAMIQYYTLWNEANGHAKG